MGRINEIMGFLLQIQLGDKNNFLGISYDALLTGLIPILIFILGYIFNKIIEKRKEKKRLNELEDYFKKLIELLNNPVNKQKNEFVKFSHYLKEKKEQFLTLNDVTNFHVDQIREINNEDLYKIFIKNKKGSLESKTGLYGKLRANIDLIDQVKKSIREDFPLFWEKYDKYQQDYKLNIDTISVLFQSMVSDNMNSLGNQDLFLMELDNIISNWQALKNTGIKHTDMYVTKYKLIDPVRDSCRRHFANPRSAIVSKYVMRCVYAFHNIEETRKVFRRHFLLLAKKLQNSWFEINETLEKYDSMKKEYSISQYIIKIVLSILFMICLFQMPYSYFQGIRFIGLLGFALLAYYEHQKTKKIDSGVIIYFALALLFQPFIKIALGRTIWNIVDVMVSICLIVSVFVSINKKDK